MGKYFGTDGFRGEFNVDLKAEHAYKIGRFLANYYKDKNVAIVGRDTRISGPILESALIAGFATTGMNVKLLGVTSTPSVAYLTKDDDVACGVMLTASHNPYYDNGIKIFVNGNKIQVELEDLIEEYLDNQVDSISYANRTDLGTVTTFPKGLEKYLEYLKSCCNKIDLKKMKIGLDLANGSTTRMAKNLFVSLGASIEVIGNNPNGYNINDFCGSTHIENIRNFVISNNLDLGLSFDGDGDRLIAVDNSGRIIDGDIIMFICGSYMSKQEKLNKNTIATTVMSNYGLYNALDDKKISYVKTPVGDKYISETMVTNGYNLGGEQSGHIIFMDYANSGDGLLTALKLLEVIKNSNTSLSKLADDITILPQKLVNIPVEDKNIIISNPKLLELCKQIDKELEKQGRLLVRASGTESLIRIMVEAPTSELCQHYIDIVKAKIENISSCK